MVNYNKDLVTNKISQYFSKENQEKALAKLELYKGQEQERVQIAIIKLADGDLEKLISLVDVANGDFRDVLAWAEYPEQSKRYTWKMKDSEVKEIQYKDRQQYLDWLNN